MGPSYDSSTNNLTPTTYDSSASSNYDVRIQGSFTSTGGHSSNKPQSKKQVPLSRLQRKQFTRHLNKMYKKQLKEQAVKKKIIRQQVYNNN